MMFKSQTLVPRIASMFARQSRQLVQSHLPKSFPSLRYSPTASGCKRKETDLLLRLDKDV